MTIHFAARYHQIKDPINYSRIFDFGSGAGTNNVLFTQYGKSGKFSLSVFEGSAENNRFVSKEGDGNSIYTVLI